VDPYLTEKEQIALIKGWFKRHGSSILLAIIIVAAVSLSWRYWQYHKHAEATRASTLFSQMVDARVQHKPIVTHHIAKSLMQHYAQTPYGKLAAFMLARNAILKNHLDTAIKRFDWIIDHSSNRLTQAIARLRMSRVLIAQHQPNAALKELAVIQTPQVLARANEIRGDAYVSMHQPKQALLAYQRAASESPHSTYRHPLLMMKIHHLESKG